MKADLLKKIDGLLEWVGKRGFIEKGEVSDILLDIRIEVDKLPDPATMGTTPGT